MDVTEILTPLNEAQREAVAASSGNLLVLAGAGSGKTRVLVHRIAWLIRSEGFSAYAVLAVTFTNKAAREMRGRIEDILQMPARGLWVGTFHGLAHRLLKAHWREVGLPQQFQILDSDDQLRVIKRIFRDLELDEARWPPKQAQWFINAKKDEGLRVRHVEIAEGDLYSKTMLRIYAAYEDVCDRGGLVDFAELLLRAHELWLRSPETLAHYQQRFKTILIDEFQDTNTIQYAWLRVLAGATIPVVAVGDDDQSIYGWRGAKMENIHRFQEDFAQTKIVRLEQNYRSTQVILEAANSLISRNSDRLGKNLWTEGKRGNLITLYAAYNEQDEARYIVERADGWLNEGRTRQSVAILYRSNAQSRALEEAFLREGIPYRIYGGQRFYERLEIRNALAYLRLIQTRTDDPALERVLNTPPRGIGSKTVEKLREIARGEQISLWHAIDRAGESKALPARALKALSDFQALINEFGQSSGCLSLQELTEHIIEVSGLKAYHRAEKGERGQARLENLQELVIAARLFEPEDETLPPLQAFLDSAALDAGEGQADPHEDSIQMMTLHSAKGLEFPLVFIAGMEENLFPHKMSLEEPGRLEEERRLAYVGITRAMEQLVVTYAENRRLHGGDTYNTLSRFIREIPGDLVEEVRLNGAVTRSLNVGGRLVQSESTVEGLDLGRRVLHQVFGEGVGTQFEGQGSNTRVEVNFAEGTKWLVLQYANLEVL